ncbi:MAG: hypothetical protein GC204_04330 [Chloroflexi bacterium]|nr:hypothetical protein [Chloroflexota bacterium]
MIPEQLARPLAARVNGLPDLDDTRANTTPFTDEGVLDAAEEALKAGKTHYTDRPGILPLREQISAYLGQLGLELAPGAITITCGLTEARFVAFKQWLAKDKTLYTSDPTLVAGVLHLLGANAAQSPTSAAVIYARTPDELAALVRDLPAESSAWLIWELADDLTPEASKPVVELIQSKNLLARLLVIGELPGLAGWRVGWMAGSSAAEKLRTFKQSISICTPSISQWAALGESLKAKNV